jgi:hypothetical protein
MVYSVWCSPECSITLCSVLCCGVLCCAVLWCAVLWCAVLCCAVLCCGVLCCAVLCCAVLWCGVVWCGVVCCAVVWCTVVYCTTISYCIFLFHSALHGFIYRAILRRYPTLLFPNPPTVPYPYHTFTSGRLGPACKRTRSSCMSVTSSGEEIKSWREDLRWIINDASCPACVLTCYTMCVCLCAWESVFECKCFFSICECVRTRVFLTLLVCVQGYVYVSKAIDLSLRSVSISVSASSLLERCFVYWSLDILRLITLRRVMTKVIL